MYSRLQIARKYIRYYLTAKNGRGHGVHSPFVYDFIRNVLNDRRRPAVWDRIELLRAQLLKDETWLEVEDMGAGSSVAKGRQRQVREIARHAAKPAKLGQLLFRIARYYQRERVVELGTSLGLSTAYLGSGAASVWTIEGASAIAAVAARNFQDLGLGGVELVVGNFDELLDGVLDRAGSVDLAFIDGNHRLEPTLRYFHALMERCAPGAILIFDDIHWSEEMEEAWGKIQRDPRVYMTIDLFFIGLVVFREEFKVKQHFSIRF
ncbi:MAG: SAM-dependent methyltransferase [Sphingobacteriales bacterium 50-39]|nr:MAG: SAM-dependent methyltransferase [Sphingobacteriales bacterium 50-39]